MIDLTQAASAPAHRAIGSAKLPSIALLRGQALNPFELQAYTPLLASFDLLGVGRCHPPYEVDRISIPTVLLHAAGEHRVAAAVVRRSRRFIRSAPDPDSLLGLRRATIGREILHAAETVLTVSEQAAGLVASYGPKLMLTCWETIPFRYDDDPVLAARKIAVKRSTSQYIAVTSRARDALIEEGVRPSMIRVVPAAVDCTRFRPTPPSNEVRAAWGVPADAKVVLYVGRLIQEKGIVELVRAFARCSDPDACLVLVGAGDQAARVRAAAVALNIAGRVSVHPHASYSQLPEIYSSADVVVAPSLTTPYWEEQFGMVLAEAMACGRPLITTASGAIPEVVGPAAVIVEPYRIDQLAGALDSLLSNVSLRGTLGAAGRRRALMVYDVPVVAPQLAAAYRDLLRT